jgi:hypothetical protein
LSALRFATLTAELTVNGVFPALTTKFAAGPPPVFCAQIADAAVLADLTMIPRADAPVLVLMT